MTNVGAQGLAPLSHRVGAPPPTLLSSGQSRCPMLDTTDAGFCYTTVYMNPELGYLNFSVDVSKDSIFSVTNVLR